MASKTTLAFSGSSASSACWLVRMITLTSECFSRICLVALMPSSRGMSMSIRTTSGNSSSTRSIASMPSAASPITGRSCVSCEDAGWHGAHPQLARTEEAIHPRTLQVRRCRLRAGGAHRMLGPRWPRTPMGGVRRRLGSGGRSWSTVSATVRSTGATTCTPWWLIVLAGGPAPVAPGSAG
jgi:hypothetical protein